MSEFPPVVKWELVDHGDGFKTVNLDPDRNDDEYLNAVAMELHEQGEEALCHRLLWTIAVRKDVEGCYYCELHKASKP